jgi:hypothetical protein
MRPMGQGLAASVLQGGRLLYLSDTSNAEIHGILPNP